MPNSVRPRFAFIASVTLISVCFFAAPLFAQYTYIGPNNGSWQVAGFWTPFIPPAFVPPPGVGDTAIINSNVDVILTDDVVGLIGFLLSGEADLLTNGEMLAVNNVDGTAEANVVGTGATGNNTELFVQPNTGGVFEQGLNVDVLNLTSGAELDLVNGGIVYIERLLHVDADSIITGDGTIRFVDDHAVNGRRFDLRGTIRPDVNDTITLIAESGTIDLDGQVHNDNLVDLTNSNSRLVVDGPLTDSFTGTIEMGNGATLTMQDAWIHGPEPGGAGGASLIEIDPGVGNFATINGAQMTIGGGGEFDANVHVHSGIGRIAADAIIQSNADIDVFSDAELDFEGTLTFTGAASISGAGTFSAGEVNFVNADVTIETNVIDFDDGDWEISKHLTLNVGSVDSVFGNEFGNVSGVTREINIDSLGVGDNGRLTVNMPGDTFWALAVDAVIDIAAPGGFLAATNISGSELKIKGEVSINGNSIFSAPIDLDDTGLVQTENAGSSWNLSADSVLDGGTIAGDGEFRSSSATVTGHGLIETDVRFSSTAELLADNGTLRITGDLNDLGAAIGTADGDGVLLLDNNDSWDTAIAGEIRLNGGLIIDGASLNFWQHTAGGLIIGHGTIDVESINNYGTIAAQGGELEIVDRLDWDGSASSGLGNEGSGVLSARNGDLRISSPMFGGPSFVGVIGIADGRDFVYDTGSGADEILFDDATGDGDAGNSVGRLEMDGGRLIADIVTHEGQFTIDNSPSTIVANEILFTDLGTTAISSQLRLDTSAGLASAIQEGATFSGDGSLVNTDGSIMIVLDEADINVDLINEGALHIGAGPFLSAESADIEVQSLDQTASATLMVDLSGDGLDEFDRISAVDGAFLDGELSLALLGDFSLIAGDMFEVITAGAPGVDGTFANVTPPDLSGDLMIDVIYNANNVILQILTPYNADFDGDGDVDGDDFLIWQSAFGMNTNGDADNDGDTDGDDFLIWQSEFGSGTGSTSAAVPEPNGFVFAVLLTLSLGACARQTASHRVTLI